MTAPPSSVGAVQVTTASLSPGSAAIEAGAPGREIGVAWIPDVAGPSPAELVAVTMNVYSVPLVSPVTVQVSGPEVHVQ